MRKKTLLLFFALLMTLLCSSGILLNAQQVVLKHSYTFDDGTVADVVGHADGKIHGNAKVANGQFIANDPGQFIELPAENIRINTYSAITLESFIGASPLNGSHTMLCYFGDTIRNWGTNHLYQSAVNGGSSKSAIACKNNDRPWITETATRGKLLVDGKYHHLVTTFDNKQIRLYVDGKLAEVATINDFPNNIISNIGDQFAFLCKGGYADDKTWWGTIDQFNIYEGVLDEESITSAAREYLDRMKSESVNSLFSDLVVDASGQFEKPVTAKAVFFAEVIPKEKDGNNWVDELFTLSDEPLVHWGSFSTAIRFSGLSGFVDVSDEDQLVYNLNKGISVEIDQVYHCWVEMDVPANTYSLYVKTPEMKQPVLIWKNARFKKKATSISYWSAVHNKSNSSDAMKLSTVETVDKIGAYPKGFKSSAGKVVFSIDKDPVPPGALAIDNPKVAFKMGTMQLRKVVLTDQSTVLYFHTPVPVGSWIGIPRKTFIKMSDSDEKLFLTGTEGIPIDTHVYGSGKGFVEYKLVFPAIDKKTSSFTYSEADAGGAWSIDGIELKTDLLQIPESNYGNWYNAKTGDWELSLFEQKAIYKNKLWELDGDLAKSTKGVIKLSGHGEPLILYYRRKGNQMQLGETPKALHTLDKKSRYTTVSKPSDPEPFKSPVFKPDTAKFSGYYYGYRAGGNNKTATIYVSDVISGEQANHLLEIQDNGYFSVRIPITYPHEVYVRMQGIRRLFLEPGKEVFVLLNVEQNETPLIMGANARLIYELTSPDLNNLQMNTVYQEIQDVVLDMAPEQFKSFILNKRDQDLNKLEGWMKARKVSQRFYQLEKREIYFSSARDILHYGFSAEQAYRQKYNIPSTQRELSVKFSIPDNPLFYDFIENAKVNDEQALLAASFGNFINALKYSQVIRARLYSNVSFSDIVKSVYQFGEVSADEKVLFEQYIKLLTDEYNSLEMEFQRKYLDRVQKMIQSNKKLFTSKENEPAGDESGVLKGMRKLAAIDSLSDDDRAVCRKAIEYYGNPLVLEVMKFQGVNNEVLSKVSNTNQRASAIFLAQKRNLILNDQLRIESGLCTDLMFSEDLLQQISEQMTPFRADLLDKIEQYYHHKTISNYVKVVNNTIIANIEANKNSSNYVLNNVSVTEADKIFDAIISKYKGKVVYVDFWATWCGPCRMSIQNQKAMKEELSGQDIAFVYITNRSSPENTYKNMIPTIKGEHYRVTDDEWNYLSKKFNISGIPHYAIIDKQGKVVDPNASREPEILKDKFKKLLLQ